MKKTILMIAAFGISVSAIAQDKYVTTALTALKQGNYEEAKENIDKAMLSPETKEKPKALFAKVQVYDQLQNIEKYKETHPYREEAATLIKLAEIKPDYEKALVDQGLIHCAYLYFNDGVKANNDRKYAEAAEFMKNVVKIHDVNGGKRFEKAKGFDTVAANANLIVANTSYYQGKYAEAIPLLISVKNNPITQTASVYESLIKAYNEEKKSAEAFATIQEARKQFPNDVILRNVELNYYIASGKQEELVKKLEEAATKEPDNADIQYNLATTYLGMATPKDGKKPANAAELITKSESAFQNALKLVPDNAVFNYNFGAYYFNQGTDYNDQMNAITGTSAADQKKYDELKAKRDGFFVKSLPYFEKSYSLLSVNESSLKGEDKTTYKNTLMALNRIYNMQSKLDKAAEMKKKSDAIN